MATKMEDPTGALVCVEGLGQEVLCEVIGLVDIFTGDLSYVLNVDLDDTCNYDSDSPCVVKTLFDMGEDVGEVSRDLISVCLGSELAAPSDDLIQFATDGPMLSLTLLCLMRENIGWSRARFAREAELAPTLYGQIEKGRTVPYDVWLTRIAAVVRRESSWSGEDRDLLKPVHFTGHVRSESSE